MVGVLVAVAVVYALFAATTGKAPEWTAVRTTCEQPTSVTYSDGRYEVTVREPTVSLSVASSEPYAVVGREGNSGSYGVFVELNSSTEAEDVTCRWEPDRVEVVEPNGIVHSVPAEVFMGGR